MGSVFGCGDDGGLLGDGFVSLELGEGPGRSFLRTAAP